MDKKLKLNAFLKGVSIFAFVAFCLLAILAGVTLPFVGNSSTSYCSSVITESDLDDCAVACAESDNLYIPLSQVQANTVYYAISVPDDSTNINAVISSSTDLFFISVNNSDIQFKFNAVHLIDKNYVRAFIIKDGISYDYQRLFCATVYSLEFRYDSGFTFVDINSINSLAFNLNILVRTVPFSSEADVVNLQNQIATLTAEKNSLQIQVNNLNSQVTDLQNLIYTLTAEKSSLQTQLTEKQNQIDTLTAEKSALQTQLTEKQNQIDTLTAEKTSLQTQLTEKQNQIDTLTAEKSALQTQLTEKLNQIDTLTAEKNALQSELNNLNFISRFGNFVGLASSDFYINLDVAPIIPIQLCQVLVPGSDSLNDNWFLKGHSSTLDIYYLPLFDKYYVNGSVWVGNVNCGWILDYFYGSSVPQLRFRVFGTDIWRADCDFNKTSGLISNVRNGNFLVSSNFISDANVYKISSADDSLYIMRDVYNNVDYSSFLDSFIAQQDFKNVKIPSDNALYLKGYQSASDEYYNDGYNTGFSDGQKSGYNTGFSAGDSAGYSRGLEDSNNYSFLSLFGAVFDAPIQALFGGTHRLPAGTKITDSNGNTITLQTATTVNRGGLLNFELMGVNLSGFVLALFSLSILIVVIKFALGKR